MSYGILWLSHVSCSLLFVAVTAAVASRCGKPLWRRFWPILAAVFVLGPVAATALGGAYLIKENIQPQWVFWYGLSEAIVYIIGVIIILRRGLEGADSERQAARFWPRARLAVVFGAALFIFAVTMGLAEMRIMIHLANVRNEATGRMISLLPARLPEAFNAHPVYEQATRELGPRQDLPEWFHESNKPDFDPSRPEVRPFLSRHQGALATIRRAASMPAYSLEVDVANFYEWPIPSYAPYLNFAKLLSLSARSKALAGDLPGALGELAVIDRTVEHLSTHPLLVSSMIAGALEEIRCQGLEYVLAKAAGPQEAVIDFPIQIHPSVRNSFLKAVRSEAQGSLQGLAIIASSYDVFAKGSDQKAWPDSGSMGATIATKFWRVFFLPSELRAAKDIIAFNMSKPAESYAEAKRNLRAIRDAAKSGKMGIFTAIVHPDHFSFILRAMLCDVHRGLSDLALAVSAFKADRGAYPSGLEDLVPEYIAEIPTDPFADAPIGMNKVEGGLALYCVGPEPEDSPAGSRYKGPIHFYLGQAPYQEYRVKPAQEERRKEAQEMKTGNEARE